MEPLFDKNGRLHAWLQGGSDHIFSLTGEPLAFITWGNVYDWRGRHLGWWDQGHMRDYAGAVCVFTRDALGLIVAKPGLGGTPGFPGVRAVSGHPGIQGAPSRPPNTAAWSETIPF